MEPCGPCVDIFALHLHDGEEGELVSSAVGLDKVPEHHLGLYLPEVNLSIVKILMFRSTKCFKIMTKRLDLNIRMHLISIIANFVILEDRD